MLQIKPKKLIKAVKCRPALYDKKHEAYYSSPKYKQNYWREVCQEVLPNYDSLSSVQKAEYVLKVQRRWKSLRTCFTRELAFQRMEKMQSEKNLPCKYRKKYGYFEALKFLLNDGEEDREEKTMKEESDSDDPLDACESPIEFEFNESNEQTANLDTIVEGYEIPVSNTNDESRLVTNESKMEEGNDDDKLFVMSLIPLFKKLTDRKKLVARIEVMKTLQRICYEDEEKDT